MAFDGLLLFALTSELNKELMGARIDRIFQPERELLIINIRNNRQNYRLLISTAPDSARIHTTDSTFTNPKQPPTFCMSLRKHLEGGRISGFYQQPLERMISVEIETYDELGEPVKRILRCELMGKHSNVVLLTEQDKILDALKRFNAFMNEYRQILPGLPYTPPPEQHKANPFTLTEDTFIELLLNQPLERKVSKGLLTALSGFSPQSCKQVLSRAGLGTDLTIEKCGQYDFSIMWQALNGMLKELKESAYTPTLVSIAGTFNKYSPFDLSPEAENEQKIHFPSINKALDTFFSEKRDQKLINEMQYSLNTKLKSEINRLTKKITINQKKLQEAVDAQEFRIMGEIITANIYRTKPGQKELAAKNFYTDETVTIPLKPQLTPADNAQRYFKRYQKAKKGGEVAKRHLKEAEDQLRYLESIQQAVLNSEYVLDLEEIKQELIAANIISKKPVKKNEKTQPQRSQPRQLKSSDGITILVGKNNHQNDIITLKLAKSDYTWLHVKDIPGSHVVISAAEFPRTTLEEAALLAAFYSKARASANVPVDYTLVKHVRKPKGAKPGMVIYDHQKTLFVTPDELIVKKLERTNLNA